MQTEMGFIHTPGAPPVERVKQNINIEAAQVCALRIYKGLFNDRLFEDEIKDPVVREYLCRAHEALYQMSSAIAGDFRDATKLDKATEKLMETIAKMDAAEK